MYDPQMTELCYKYHSIILNYLVNLVKVLHLVLGSHNGTFAVLCSAIIKD